MEDRIGIKLSTSIESLRHLIAQLVQRGDFELASDHGERIAHVLLDLPVSWAFSIAPRTLCKSCSSRLLSCW